jgi:hypothetical protein
MVVRLGCYAIQLISPLTAAAEENDAQADQQSKEGQVCHASHDCEGTEHGSKWPDTTWAKTPAKGHTTAPEDHPPAHEGQSDHASYYNNGDYTNCNLPLL